MPEQGPATDPRTSAAIAQARTALAIVRQAQENAAAEHAVAHDDADALRSLSHDAPPSIERADVALSQSADAIALAEQIAANAANRAPLVADRLAQARVHVDIAQTSEALTGITAELDQHDAQLDGLIERATDLQRGIPDTLVARADTPAVRAQAAAIRAAQLQAEARTAHDRATRLLDNATALADDDAHPAAGRVDEANQERQRAEQLKDQARGALTESMQALGAASADPDRDLPGISPVDDRNTPAETPNRRTLDQANAALNASSEGQALRTAQTANANMLLISASTLESTRTRLDSALRRLHTATRGLDLDGRAVAGEILADTDRAVHQLEGSIRAFAADDERLQRIGVPLGEAAVRIALSTQSADAADAAATVDSVTRALTNERPALDERVADLTSHAAELEAQLDRLIAHHHILGDQRADAETAALAETIERLTEALGGPASTATLPGTNADRAAQARDALDEHLAALRQASQQTRVAVTRQIDRHQDVLTGADPAQIAQVMTDHQRIADNQQNARRGYQEALAALRQHAHATALQQIDELIARATEVRDTAIADADQTARTERARVDEELEQRLAAIPELLADARATREQDLVAIDGADRIRNHRAVRGIERAYRAAVDEAIAQEAQARRDAAIDHALIDLEEQRTIADAEAQRTRSITLSRAPIEHERRRTVTDLSRLSIELRHRIAGTDPNPDLGRLADRSERLRARTNTRLSNERISADGRRDTRNDSAERAADERYSTAERNYRETLRPPPDRTDFERQMRLWRLLLTGVTITAEHRRCVWNPGKVCTCPRTAPKDCPLTPTPPPHRPGAQDTTPAESDDREHRPPEDGSTDPSQPNEPSRPNESSRPNEPSQPGEPSRQRDPDDHDGERDTDGPPTRPHEPPPREPEQPTQPGQPGRPDPQDDLPAGPGPHDDHAPSPSDGPDLGIPAAGDDAVPTALDAARRAAERLGAQLGLVGPDHARIVLPGREPIDLFFAMDRSGHTQAVLTTVDGRIIRITLNTDASTADIALEVASGVSTALLYDVDPAAVGPESALTRDGEVTDGTRLGMDDLRQIARLEELLWQEAHTEGPLHDAVLLALNERVDEMGLDLDSGPDAAARRRLLTVELQRTLSTVLPDWDSPHTHAPELGDGIGDELVLREARDIASTPADDAIEADWQTVRDAPAPSHPNSAPPDR